MRIYDFEQVTMLIASFLHVYVPAHAFDDDSDDDSDEGSDKGLF